MPCSNPNCCQNQGVEGLPQSVWLATTETSHFPKLEGDVSTEVVVIGGGIAGLMTAYELTERGQKVVVLEAGRIAEAITGNTTAKVTSQHHLLYDFLIKKHGRERAKLYGEAQQAGLERIAELVQKYSIDCNFTRARAYTYTTDQKEVEEVKTEVEAVRQLGLPAHFTDQTELPFKVAGAVYFENQAYFHPRKFLLKLAQVITDAGGRIFENTRVQQVDGNDESRIIIAPKGQVNTRAVVVATHYPFLDHSVYAVRMHPNRSYAVVAEVEQPLEHMYISTGDRRSFRPYSADAIIIGGEGHEVGKANEREQYMKLEKFAKDYGAKTIQYRWSAHDHTAVDRVPLIGQYLPGKKNIYVATGFGAWGMTSGALAGLLLTDLIEGKTSAWADVFDPNRLRSLSPNKRLLEQTKTAVQGLAGERIANLFKDSELPEPGDGKVITKNGRQLAIHRADDGTLVVRSAVCTHMGCIVDWNSAEKTWDCPCHGSRFTSGGKVTHGPAVKDLEEVNVEI
jgi:glycine/D-amino acid oxidase-like deaminating enzyme/nitrite reductase/ring-hydroxylating ferredoxin subunit